MTYALLGWSENPVGARFLEYVRAGIEQPQAAAVWDCVETFDVWDSLPELTCPTLVMHGLSCRSISRATLKRSWRASRTCVVWNEWSAFPYLANWKAVVRAIYRFVGEGSVAAGSVRRLLRLVNPPDELTDREREIVELIAAGKSNREIAAALHDGETLQSMLLILGGVALTPFAFGMLSIGVLSLRSGFFPRWFAWATIVVGAMARCRSLASWLSCQGAFSGCSSAAASCCAAPARAKHRPHPLQGHRRCRRRPDLQVIQQALRRNPEGLPHLASPASAFGRLSE